MKVLSMYLPQFYRTPENDAWWGEGFTDWVSTKKAAPLFSGHVQPRIPLNSNYYDLTEKETMKWQSELMHQYGIDGMCIYHYWFKDGRKVLEKPAENLLKWKDIDMPFCFYWANESWARSWSNVPEKNVWANTSEPCRNGFDSEVLLEQDYGEEEIWEEHFSYLLPFFLDDRYIKIDGKPLILIYRTESVPCLRQMLECWRKLALENDFEGIYVIGANCNSGISSVLDAILVHEPKSALYEYFMMHPERDCLVKKISYDNIWNILLASDKNNGVQTYYSGFVDYDDSPRRGKEGNVITDADPDKFKKYIIKLMVKNQKAGSDILFLNAWNEWGEGMYLEPDEAHGFGYLQALKEAKEEYSNYVNEEEEIKCDDSYRRLTVVNHRIEANMQVLNKWLELYENGISLSDFILEKYKGSIAIYGYGILGRHLYRELNDARVEVNYIIEQEKSKVHVEIPVYSIKDDRVPVADNIIVTAVYYFDDIYDRLKGFGFKNIVSIKDLINECRGYK